MGKFIRGGEADAKQTEGTQLLESKAGLPTSSDIDKVNNPVTESMTAYEHLLRPWAEMLSILHDEHFESLIAEPKANFYFPVVQAIMVLGMAYRTAADFCDKQLKIKTIRI